MRILKLQHKINSTKRNKRVHFFSFLLIYLRERVQGGGWGERDRGRENPEVDYPSPSHPVRSPTSDSIPGP